MIKCDIATVYGLSNYYKYVKRVIILVKDICKINKKQIDHYHKGCRTDCSIFGRFCIISHVHICLSFLLSYQRWWLVIQKFIKE